MTVLVTGGAGYIGSHTVRLLVQQRRDVVVLDSLEFGDIARVGDVPFFEGDISDSRIINKICRKYDINEVIHFAAYKAVGESMEACRPAERPSPAHPSAPPRSGATPFRP